MFAEDMNVNVADDQIGEDVTPAPPTTAHVIPDDEVDDAAGAGRKKPGTPASPPPSHENEKETTNSSRLSRELSKLNTYYNPTVAVIPDEPLTLRSGTLEQVNCIEEDVVCVHNVELASDPGEPKTVHEALAGPERLQWIKAMKNKL